MCIHFNSIFPVKFLKIKEVSNQVKISQMNFKVAESMEDKNILRYFS